jgi:hypothetical protein
MTGTARYIQHGILHMHDHHGQLLHRSGKENKKELRRLHCDHRRTAQKKEMLIYLLGIHVVNVFIFSLILIQRKSELEVLQCLFCSLS